MKTIAKHPAKQFLRKRLVLIIFLWLISAFSCFLFYFIYHDGNSMVIGSHVNEVKIQSRLSSPFVKNRIFDRNVLSKIPQDRTYPSPVLPQNLNTILELSDIRFDNLESAWLHDSCINPQRLNLWNATGSLRFLTIDFSFNNSHIPNTLGPAYYKSIGRFTNLECLELNAATIAEEGIEHLATLKELKYFKGDDMTEKSLAVIAKLPSLQGLKISLREGQGDAVTKLAQMPELKFLDLKFYSTNEANPESIRSLTRCPKLESIEFRSWVDQDCLVALKGSPSLRELHLTSFFEKNTRFDAKAFDDPGDWPNLNVIDCSFTASLDLAAIKRLAALSTLKMLRLKSLPNEGLETVVWNSKGIYVEIYDQKVSFDPVRKLLNESNIQGIFLHQTNQQRQDEINTLKSEFPQKDIRIERIWACG